MDIQKLTKEQAVIISGFTGILCGEFSDFHADVEKRLGRGVQTFEFGFKEFSAEVKRLYEADFIEMGTVSKEEAKAQAVPEWIDYTKQSPRIDGRYQIFISGEQITADWQSPFGFSDPVEGEALIQDLISHWGMLPEPPKPQELAND
ncbi:hypothetical protein [Acinetobacter sp. YH12098]|uniref:DUF7736 domain-containing protein n=1 Tax=Acinetobacter sp. YH12098 TaxID=2601087 RepID=UPI001C55380F|nr:hypothetical protein [Acinetobacter sp. YH12098]